MTGGRNAQDNPGSLSLPVPDGGLPAARLRAPAAGSTGAGPNPAGRNRRSRPGRIWSLKREWSRAFLLMLVALLVGAAATILGVRGVTDQVQDTAGRLRLESQSVAGLRAVLETNEQTGLRLLSGSSAEADAFLQQQQDLARRFDDAAAALPAERGMRATMIKARAAWQESLAAHGLWGGQVLTLHGNHSDEAAAFAAETSGSREMLAGIERSSLEEMDAGLAYGAELQQIVIAARSGLFVLAAAGVVYFRRRMVKYLVRPIEGLHRGVMKLQNADYTHRIDVVRRDELGELAEAFNTMAAAVHGSHLALTHRATHDPLTGLANRAALTERLASPLQPGNDGTPRHEGLLVIDVDDFKDVNDSLGHAGGDALLIQLGQRLQACVRGRDLVARLGGDEFAIVVADDGGGSPTGDIAERIHDALRAPFSIGGVRSKVTVSMGPWRDAPSPQTPPSCCGRRTLRCTWPNTAERAATNSLTPTGTTT